MAGFLNGLDDTNPSNNGQRAESLTILSAHQTQTLKCLWSPTSDTLATAAGDGTSRLWNLTDKIAAQQNHIILQHRDLEEALNFQFPVRNDVLTIDWSADGQLIVTGAYDGRVRTWGRNGSLLNVYQPHRGPVMGVAQNKSNSHILSCGSDKQAVVIDTNTGFCTQRYFHSSPILHVDWQNDNAFASCSTRNIFICDVHVTNPIRVFREHEGEINAIKWDPQGSLLASASDDSTVKIWSPIRNTSMHNFVQHTEAVYSISWSKTGPGTDFPNTNLLLASGSVDKSVMIWNTEIGLRLQVLRKHTESVYSVAFSPDGKYLASGGMDKMLHIWSPNNGILLHSCHVPGGVTQVNWNSTGTMVAAATNSGDVAVLDIRNL